MMGFIWFWLVAVMIVGYVVLDGFDLGVGVLHLFLVRNETERRTTLASIGPVWDGNEVWLLAGGGTLYFAFPLLYASAFSGFYLPLMIVFRCKPTDTSFCLCGPLGNPAPIPAFSIGTR